MGNLDLINLDQNHATLYLMTSSKNFFEMVFDDGGLLDT